METADKGSQTLWNSPAIDDGKWPCKRTSQFLFCLTKSIVTAFALATLSLFGLNAGMDYATTQTSPAMAAQTRHADLPAYAEKLAATCLSGPQVVLMASPVTRCMDLAAQTAQHLLGTSLSAGMIEHLSTNMVRITAKSLKTVAYRLAPAWLGARQRSAVFVLH